MLDQYNRRRFVRLLFVITILFGLMTLVSSGCGSSSNSISALDQMRSFSNQDLQLVRVGENGGLDTGAAKRIFYTLNPIGNELTLTFKDTAGATLTQPVILIAIPGKPGEFAGDNRSAFGRTDLSMRARLTKAGNVESGVFLSVSVPLPQGGRVAMERGRADLNQKLADDKGRREAIRSYGETLPATGQYDQLDRFAEIVQTVVDTNVGAHVRGGFPLDNTLITFILNDMADLFLPVDYKAEMMPNGVFQLERTGGDPANMTGFSTQFTQGEGRFRHMTANAYMMQSHWAITIYFVALVVGGDNPFGSNPDSLGDIASNEIGRDLYRLLVELAENGKINDGTSVKQFLHAQFGNRTLIFRPPYPPSTQNLPPRLRQFTNVFLGEAHSNQMQIVADDPEGDPLTFTWSWSGPGTTCGADRGSVGGQTNSRLYYHDGCSSTAEQATKITVTVSDGKGNTRTYTHDLRREGQFSIDGNN